MFECDLDELSTADLLSVAAEFAQVQEQAAVGVLRAALAFADRHAVVSWQTPDQAPLPGHERLVVYGGEGCPGVAEFAPLEFGAVLGISSGAAASLIGEALALRHRLPRVWAAVLAGEAVAWRARKVAEACLSLSIEAAAIVDRRVAGIVNSVTPYRLKKIVTAAIWQADPARAKADAEAAARARGVFVSQSDDHGTKRIWVRAAAGAVIRFDATIDDLARALKAMGDTDSLDERRAKAIDWIADPAAAHRLIEVARHLATTATGTEGATGKERAAGTERAGDTARAAGDGGEAATASAAGQPQHPGGAADSASSGDAARVEDSERYGDERARVEEAYLIDTLGWESSIPGEFEPDPVNLTDQSATAQEPFVWGAEPSGVDGETDADASACQDEFARRAMAAELAARLAAIKRDAHRAGVGAGSAGRGRVRGRHTVYVHLTDHTLATGTGVLRVEELGPLLAGQLGELLGHDQVVVKPVIDLHDQVSVHSYEIPDRIRERVRLRHPVDMFPFSGAEATARMDQDHIVPYDHTQQIGRTDAGSPGDRGGQGGGQGDGGGQTSVDRLIPLGRRHHRAKTFGGWRNRRLPSGAVDWISPNGFRFVVDHTGTHPPQGVVPTASPG